MVLLTILWIAKGIIEMVPLSYFGVFKTDL